MQDQQDSLSTDSQIDIINKDQCNTTCQIKVNQEIKEKSILEQVQNSVELITLFMYRKKKNREQILQNLKILLPQLTKTELKSVITQQLIVQISAIGFSQTYQLQKLNLSVLMIIAEYGAESVISWYQNDFFKVIVQSEMLQSLKKSINFYEYENKGKQEEMIIGTEFAFQLAHTYICIMKNKIFADNAKWFCQRVIFYHIQKYMQLIIYFDQEDENDDEGNDEEEDDSDDEEEDDEEEDEFDDEQCISLEYVMNQLIKLLKDIIYSKGQLARCYKLISPLIHVNCDSSLNCNQQITLLPQVKNHPIQIYLFRAFNSILEHSDIKQYLLENHAILAHLAEIINNFALNQSQIIQQTNSD